MFNELVRFEDKIYLSNNLKVFAIEEGRLGLKIDLEKSFDIKNTFIRKIAVFGKLLAVVLDSKLLLTIDLVTCEKTYETMTFKRAMFLYFSENNSIYLGDRAGDIYEIHLSADKPMRLLVGSVSISTDMVFCSDRKYLITADRDEKIRVNYFPNTYDIKHFCLGHKEYVSNVILLSNTDCFLSAGGDQHIFMWSYTTGELLEKISLVENVDLGILKPDVASMEIFKNKLLLVQLQK